MPFQPLGDILKKNIQQAGISEQVGASVVLEKFMKIASEMWPNEDIQKGVKPLYVKSRTLTVACLSSVLAQDIKLKERTIIEKLNKEMGESLVDRIRYLL